ncbi:MAG: GTPase HflX [Chromatiales bacterium]|nr:GTPase HflX [Chromatiales bacterium]
MVNVDLFERPAGGERAVLVHVNFDADGEREDVNELKELAVSAGANPVAIVTASRHTPDSRLFIGSGKAEELRQRVEEEGAEVVLFNHTLSPSQERNLERLLKCQVMDRTGLILDIFAQRASTHEGKLQVELAQLRHLSTRLVRGWTHLERQKGGIGLRGPGETQLETDRRLIGLRMKMLQKRLEKVRSQRGQGRRARTRAMIPTVSLVGYTNAGKSTLFNALAGSGVFAADQLFATLDPTLRRVEVAPHRPLILADTVGFIRHLPHDLVAAFRSTLEETAQADLLIHVIDAADPGREGRIEQVDEVLEQIDAQSIPQIRVYNKLDLLPGQEPRVERNGEGRVSAVWLSAASGNGLNLLVDALSDYFGQSASRRRFRLPPQAGGFRARLFGLGRVMEDRLTDSGEWLMEVEFDDPGFEQALERAGLQPTWLATGEQGT